VPVLDTGTVAFLEGGRGLIVGVVSRDQAPCIARAWGITVVSAHPPMARLLVPCDDPAVLDALTAAAPVAVTAGNVRTYRSIQLKGRSLGVEPATEQDQARGRRYIEDFFAELLAINMMPTEMCERFVPVGFAACTLTIDALYDQTPGPGAGAVFAGLT
jgi:hypothetical protein